MQQLTSGKLSSPQQHFLGEDSTSILLKNMDKVVFDNIHGSIKQLSKETQNKNNIKWLIHKPPLITMFFYNIVLSPAWASIQTLPLYF